MGITRMRARLTFPLAALALAGCAGTFYSTLNGSATTAPDDAYVCLENQLKTMGYQRAHYDPSQHWYQGQKVDPTARVSSIQFRRRIDRIDVRVKPETNGSSHVDITAHTFDEYSSQQGVIQTERSASTQVKLDAQTVMEACGK
jgi:hypothetical protein